jgi:hypothetical protein
MAESLTHKEAVDKHVNRIYDAVALLEAAAERIDAHAPPYSEQPEKADAMHNTMRLVQMAMELCQGAASDFSAAVFSKTR